MRYVPFGGIDIMKNAKNVSLCDTTPQERWGQHFREVIALLEHKDDNLLIPDMRRILAFVEQKQESKGSGDPDFSMVLDTERKFAIVELIRNLTELLYSPASNSSEIFDDFEAMTVLVQKSFANAAKKAVAENDALGIPTPYSKNGKIFYRQPHKAPNKLR